MSYRYHDEVLHFLDGGEVEILMTGNIVIGKVESLSDFERDLGYYHFRVATN